MPTETRSARAARAQEQAARLNLAASAENSNQEVHDQVPNPVNDLISHLKNCSIQADRSQATAADDEESDQRTPILTAAEFETELVDRVNEVYATLGNAQGEKSYQRALALEIADRGLTCLSEWEIPIMYKDRQIGTRRADLIVQVADGSQYVLELKAVQKLAPEHLRQLKYYMVHFRIHRGMLINFPKAQTFPDLEVEDGAPSLDFEVAKIQGENELRDLPTRKARPSKVAPEPEIHRVGLPQS